MVVRYCIYKNSAACCPAVISWRTVETWGSGSDRHSVVSWWATPTCLNGLQFSYCLYTCKAEMYCTNLRLKENIYNPRAPSLSLIIHCFILFVFLSSLLAPHSPVLTVASLTVWFKTLSTVIWFYPTVSPSHWWGMWNLPNYASQCQRY